MQMLHYYSIVSPLPLVSTQQVCLNCLWSICRIAEICTVMVKNFRGLLLQTERLGCHLADWQSTATEKYVLPAVTIGLGLCSLMLILLWSTMSCDVCCFNFVTSVLRVAMWINIAYSQGMIPEILVVQLCDTVGQAGWLILWVKYVKTTEHFLLQINN